MGIFDRLGKSLGTGKDLDIEEYMGSAEMEDVDVMNEPADFYVKPINLQQESDLQVIEEELGKKNIILLNISDIAKRPQTLKGIIDKLREHLGKINGDIAKIDPEKLLVTPARVKIIKSRKPASTQARPI
ncbi:MAG: cell division protein SepF [Candidatus Marsarchaeota archaeon]|jgi:hypothetical protein|nr:cell division protein SepF [Candidatus Marsarchaeota archaeon]MCL5112694.1 cell division protein SepF [Candidatus Marsarchaeota archaeon]